MRGNRLKAWGALIISNPRDPDRAQYDEGHELTIALSDWFNPSVAAITEWYLSPDSTLFNVTREATYRLRVVNKAAAITTGFLHKRAPTPCD